MSKKFVQAIEVDGGATDSSGLKFTRMTSASANVAGSPIGVDSSGNVVKIAAGAAQGATGTAVVDFGSGNSEASVVITGQSSIVAGSVIRAWINPIASSNNEADAHLRETLNIVAGSIVPGTGFTVYAFKWAALEQDTLAFGQYNVFWQWL